jgi:hypothetical protein
MQNERSGPDPAHIQINCLEDLRTNEGAILKRLHAIPNGGRLLLLDPQRCLQELGVTLSEEAKREWEAAAGVSFTRRTGLEAAYDGVARSTEPSPVRVRINGLLPRGKK